MTLAPRDLPKLRDQTHRHAADPGSHLRAKTGADKQAGLAALAHHLQAADLYWVAPDMAALAMSSGQQLAAARWATADRPSPCGLIHFDGGIGHIDAHGVHVPIEACVWGPHGDDCLIWTLISRRRLASMIRPGVELIEELTPPYIPLYGVTVPITTEPVPMADIDPQAPLPVVQALAAAWLLMQQPQLIDRTAERPSKTVQRSYTRTGQPAPEVTVVDLRRQYVPQDRDQDTDDQPGRRYRHRWVVSGHWRNQPHGPGRELRRQQWIPAYVKGPDGAPLLATERVNVWRR